MTSHWDTFRKRLLSQTASASIKAFRAFFDRADVQPCCVVERILRHHESGRCWAQDLFEHRTSHSDPHPTGMGGGV